MKKTLSMLLAVIMLMSLVACGGGTTGTSTPSASTSDTSTSGSPSSEVKYKERVVVAYSTVTSKIDPHTSSGAYDMILWRLNHDTLVDYNTTTGAADPGLAESWEIDGLTYTFHLRKGVKFHSGHDFTAEDVIYSFDRMAASSTTKSLVKDIVSKEIVDEYTVKFTLEKPNAEFLLTIGAANMVIMSKNAMAELGEEKGVTIGTGAFVLTEWKPDESVLFTRFDGYWGDAPVTKEIFWRKIAEASARVIALQTGEIDVDLGLSAVDAPHIANDPSTRLIEIPATKLVYLALNVSGRNEPLNNVLVRQALNYATNPKDFIISVREGYASVPNGCIPVGLWGYSDAVDAYEYDVEKAKALLADAGYGSGLDLNLTTSSAYAGIFEVLQAQWAKAGVNLTLNTDDTTMFNDQAKTGEYCIMTRNYNFTGIDGALRALWYSNVSSNRTKTSDPTLDAMLDEALAEMDSSKRQAMYAKISQYISDLGSFIPLYQDVLLIGEGKNVSGVFYGPVTNHNLQNIAVTID